MCDITRWNSAYKNQLNDPKTVKYCATMAFCNCVENMINRKNCYKNDIHSKDAVAWVKKNGIELDEKEIQDLVHKTYTGIDPKNPVQITAILFFFMDHEILNTGYKVQRFERPETSIETIRKILSNRLPLYAGVRGKFKVEEINGIWTTVYTAPSNSMLFHAVCIDSIDENNVIGAQDSSSTPRAIIKDIRTIHSLYAFDLIKI